MTCGKVCRGSEAPRFQRTSGEMAEALPLCYHGAISRTACEELLGKRNQDGTYLIRDSETILGAMCLCV